MGLPFTGAKLATAVSSYLTPDKSLVQSEVAAGPSDLCKAACACQVINLYTWTTPNGYKASIMLEEIGATYTVKPVNLGTLRRRPSGCTVSSKAGLRKHPILPSRR
jgi:hypothetical protein